MGACGLCALLLWLHCCWYETRCPDLLNFHAVRLLSLALRLCSFLI
jgi:hypothetical protein